ncbi:MULTISPECIES: SulP family inorganic anion transporter [Candidatus Microthrix]|jgi:SulP family sulfate permease|uniref:STAS domain-containing protein n=1 Tax=Candidatus Neomicrothrix parvicella RN1 TaxID=1229780 RepID=R4Z2M1_9ACTN|nr:MULTISPECIES: SulP family inorganic anion transporter [Microthrix]NLH64910.1 SulP family inorganic anion transporter [Candidatus Microthrix parvicella]MBK7020337.1 SulP family inorganic anion transporter [Candidatus Microthrix sp.]MBK7322298.1 SulP family inorganic anion transporter [Candidatus Microthrix sp.]MBL0203717.1 SulP family inorganic anion transporter [Candidatus Microthrix sp.]MBP6133872.1 SulP family inorganic anion transporter [Candidatus Microthrix sp.]
MTEPTGQLQRQRVAVLGSLNATLRRRFSRSTMRGDLLAALVVTALMVPQSLGYAALAGAPVQTGLYALPLALGVYAFVGSSPQLIVGPVSTVSVLTGSIVASHGAKSPQEALALVTALAIISGLILMIAGLLRLGWVADFLSKPIVTGFVFGLSILIVVGEIPTLLGLPRGSGNFFGRVSGIAGHLGEIQPKNAAVGAVALAVLFLGPRIKSVVPWGLVVVIGGLVVAKFVDFPAAGIAEIGKVPSGLPGLAIPDLSVGDMGGLLASGAALAMVGLAESLSAARLFASQNGYHVDANRELIGTGAANVAAGFSGGIGVGGSLSKTAAADNSGGRSPLTSLATMGLVVVVVLFFAPSLGGLPKVVLSAVVVHAVWPLMDLNALARYRSIRRNDFVGALAALVGVLVLGTLYGLLAAIAQSILGLIYRTSRIEVDVLGKVRSEKAAWGSVDRNPKNPTVNGIMVLRLTKPLFWVNAAAAVELITTEIEAEPDTEAVIINMEATNQLDTTSADALGELIGHLHRHGIDVHLVRVIYPTRQVLEASGVHDILGPDHMWRTISQGVKAAKKARKANE